MGDNIDINRPAKNFPNSTPLHIASTNNYVELCQFLVEKNAHLLAKDAEGNTPIDVAASDEITHIFNGSFLCQNFHWGLDYVQVKLVHERTLVIKKDHLVEELNNQFQATEKIFGNAVLEYHGNHSFTCTNKVNAMDSISREISKDSKVEAFLLLSTADHKGTSMLTWEITYS